jgi:hypothetical protein
MATSSAHRIFYSHMKAFAETQQVERVGLTALGGSYDIGCKELWENQVMEKIIAGWLGVGVSEQTSFLIKSAIFLFVVGTTLFVALGTSYPAVHDTLHQARHSLAVVPCH